MEVSSVQAPASVAIQKKAERSQEAVADKLIESVEKSDDIAREARDTGKNIDVKA